MLHVLSSQHREPSIGNGEQQKPSMIEDYSNTKGGVDNADMEDADFVQDLELTYFGAKCPMFICKDHRL